VEQFGRLVNHGGTGKYSGFAWDYAQPSPRNRPPA
jgi:hypothetical protein